MEKLWIELENLQEEFHETIENYPILEEDFNKIFDKDLKEIEELLDKNDEYYLKKAISNLEDLIKYIKDMSFDIKNLFNQYDKLTKIWEDLEIKKEISESKLRKINNLVRKSTDLINSHNYKDVKESINLFELAIKELKEYTK